MAKNKIKPQDNAANMQNANYGTSGVNKQFQQAQTNKDIQRKQSQKNK